MNKAKKCKLQANGPQDRLTAELEFIEKKCFVTKITSNSQSK